MKPYNLPYAIQRFHCALVYILHLNIGSIYNSLIPSFSHRLLHEDEKATVKSLTTIAAMASNVVSPKLWGYLI
jgi:hypothetical protein